MDTGRKIGDKCGSRDSNDHVSVKVQYKMVLAWAQTKSGLVARSMYPWATLESGSDGFAGVGGGTHILVRCTRD